MKIFADIKSVGYRKYLCFYIPATYNFDRLAENDPSTYNFDRIAENDPFAKGATVAGCNFSVAQGDQFLT
jgi:hypothetical protein